MFEAEQIGVQRLPAERFQRDPATALDDLGLSAALRALAADVSAGTTNAAVVVSAAIDSYSAP